MIEDLHIVALSEATSAAAHAVVLFAQDAVITDMTRVGATRFATTTCHRLLTGVTGRAQE
jgi:hypothetical protein